MERIAKNLWAIVRLGIYFALPVVGGCVSSERLLKHTNDKLSTCLRVGMTVNAAEKCTQKADLTFGEAKAESGVRIYANSAPAAWPVTYSVVYVELLFNQSGELVSWSSRGGYDGI